MSKSLKIEVDVSMYESLEELKDARAIDCFVKKFNDVLERRGEKASSCSIIKACKNAISLLCSKKKRISPNLLIIYLPSKVVESIQDTVVPNVSSDEDASNINVDTDSDSQLSSHSQISFLMCNDGLKVETSFEYLLDYFKYSLSVNSKPMNIDRIVNDICVYVFIEQNFSVDLRALKNEISRQIGHIVQAARRRAAGRSIINVLNMTPTFSLMFKCIIPLNQVQSTNDFFQFRNDDPMSPILLHRFSNEKKYLLQVFPFSNTIDITFNELWIEKALTLFDLVRVLDVNDLAYLIEECASRNNLHLNFQNLVEVLKTEILSYRTRSPSNSRFLTVRLKCVEPNDKQKDRDQITINDYSEAEMDNIIGRNYITRGIKRSYEEDSISVEPNRNVYQQNKQKKR